MWYWLVNSETVLDTSSSSYVGFKTLHYYDSTLRASLSGIFIQNYATDRRGTLYLRAAVHRRGQRLSKGLGTDMTGSNLAPKQANQ